MSEQLTEVRVVEQDISRWMRELKAAGWKEHYIVHDMRRRARRSAA